MMQKLFRWEGVGGATDEEEGLVIGLIQAPLYKETRPDTRLRQSHAGGQGQ